MPASALRFLTFFSAVLMVSIWLCPPLDAQETESEGTNAEAAAEKHEEHGTEPTNRLAAESSPYLLQHAHNPVDWYPWGDEAFAKAKREDKMIFLSIGYAACHWCHVMERESFTDEEIAAFMNENFVCVKVDREERPDVDQIYMTSVQLISGNGGWPMSAFLLPDAQPFWAGTYFPARTGDRGNATGFLSIIKQIDHAWKTAREKVEKQAGAVTKAIRASQAHGADSGLPTTLEVALVETVARALLDEYDPVHGGFGYSTESSDVPKFPEPSNLMFLLDRIDRESVPEAQRKSAQRMLSKTLDGMISGAMWDHLGGGFHRYSVDQKWQIPHFEKMLYDNGQLATVYALAYEQTEREEYRFVVEGICDFVLRELLAPGGAFYSALDADSEGEEGKFYRWTKDELAELESKEQYELAASVFRFDQSPNFEEHFYAPDPRMSLTEAASSRDMTFSKLIESVSEIRSEMFEIRSKRERPITDVKILTAWNGLMIAGLAEAGRVLERQEYLDAAVSATEFLLKELKDDEGRLLRSYAKEEAKLNGYIDDYAFFAKGLIALHQATGESRWLDLAKEITDKQLELFWDEKRGGFFFTSNDHDTLIARVKDPVDSAVPSGNSVSVNNMIYLTSKLPDEEGYSEKVKELLQSLVPLFRQAPNACPGGAKALASYLDQL
ncbi:MAG: thioredoxin domain-containing protein [Rubripirellula sp.]